MSKSYIIFIGILIFSVSAYGEKANMNSEALINICEAYANSINDINVVYDLEVTGLTPDDSEENLGKYIGPQKTIFTASKPFEQKYKLAQSLNIEDGKGNRLQSDWIHAYNGNIFKEYHKINKSIVPSGMISNKDIFMNQHFNITPLGFTIFHRAYDSEPLLDILKGRYDYYTIGLDPNISKVNDFNAVEVSCISNKFKPLVFKSLSFFFSVDHNYTLVKIVKFNGPNRIVKTFNITELRKLKNNIWFPAKAYSINNEGLTNTVTVIDININQNITEKDFDIEFPSGTSIQDHISGKTYRIKPTQEQVDQSSPK